MSLMLLTELSLQQNLLKIAFPDSLVVNHHHAYSEYSVY